MIGRRLQAALLVGSVAMVLLARQSEAFCGLRSGDGGGEGDFVTCLKAKAIATLDRVSRADTVPLAGSVALVRNTVDPAQAHRHQRSEDDNGGPTSERELRSKPVATLDRMLYDKAVRFFSGRAVRIGLPEFTSDQLKMALEEGNYVHITTADMVYDNDVITRTPGEQNFVITRIIIRSGIQPFQKNSIS